MIGGVTGVMILVWALVTANLMIDSYARQAAHLEDEAIRLGRLFEAWISEPGGETSPKTWPAFNVRLANSGLIDGWLIAALESEGLAVRSSNTGESAVPPEETALFRRAFATEQVISSGGPERPRAYFRFVGPGRETVVARLDLKPDLKISSTIMGTLWTSVAILVLGALTLVLLTYMLINRMVIAPLTSIVEGSRRVSEGDYSRPIPAPAREDEVATMIRAFNSMMEKLEAYHETLKSDIQKARERITDTERKLFHAQRLSTTGTLAAGIAHEINNPLGGMMNAAEVLKSGKLGAEKQAQYLELISDGLARVKAIVQKILHFRPQAFQPVPVSLREIVDRAVAFLDHKASRRGVQYAIEVEAAAAPVVGDPLELQQAILNILMNAVDAVETGRGKIRISDRREGGRAHISIQDNGMGMTPEELERCLDPFYTTKEAGEGSGLGLPVAASIVENHGGRLQIKSEKGRGTTVTIDLPAPRGNEAPPSGPAGAANS